MTFQKFSILFSLILVLIADVALAQPANPASDPDVVPITGLEYLLIAGGALGGYKLFKGRQRGDKSAPDH